MPLKSCDQVQCTGDIDGAAYEIQLPDKWNGTLLIYSHGYRQAEPSPPDFEPVNTDPAPAATEEVASALLDKGYALAGSAFKTNGWDVLDGVAADEALHTFFTEKIGTPDRVYVWGDSLGGLITETLAEKHPEWVSGAAPLCGVLGGSNLNLDLALDVAYAVKTLIYPDLKLTGFASHDEAVANWQGAYDAITKAGADVPNGVPAILLTAALVDAPSQTKTYDGATIESQVRAKAESILTALGYGTYGRYEIEQRVGGNASGNDGTDYSARVSDAERSLIETVSSGATDKLLAKLDAGRAGHRRPCGAIHLRHDGQPGRRPAGPHDHPAHHGRPPCTRTERGGVQGPGLCREGPHRRLVQLYTTPPATYPEDTGAPYGAGHCNFTTSQRVGVIDLLDGWVRDGRVPGAAAATAAFPGDDSVTTAYIPTPWPAATG